MPNPRIAILGTGLIGGSIGLSLRKRHAAESVAGWDPSLDALESAVERGAIEAAADSAAEAVRGAQVVFLASPIETVIPLLESVAPSLPARAAVTDVGSAKARIVEQAEGILGGRFVGGHPMAGHEESGIAFADSEMFEGAAWILTPTPRTDSEALTAVRDVIVQVGARPRECDPETHDRSVAFISHLPHLAAYGLADSASRAVSSEWVDSIAGSFRDGTRVALSDAGRWTEILLQNRTAVTESLDLFIDWANRVRDALAEPDKVRVGELLQDAHAARKRFPR